MGLPPLNERGFSVSITPRNRQADGSQKFNLRIVDPNTKEKVNFGEFDSRAEVDREVQRVAVHFREGRSLKSLRPDKVKKKKEDQEEVAKGAILFGRFIDDYYLRGLQVEPRTKSDYEVACNRIKSYVDDPSLKDKDGNPLTWQYRPLNSITNGEINRFLAAFKTNEAGRFLVAQRVKNSDTYHFVLNKAGKRRSSIYTRKTAQRIRSIFDVAVREKFIHRDDHPYHKDLNKLPKRPSRESECLLVREAVEDMLRILKRESQRDDWQTAEDALWGREAAFWYYLVLTAMWSGLRISELLGLKFSNLLSNTTEIRVRKQWAWKSNGTKNERLADLKSVYSKREVPMPKTIFDEVWDCWARKVRYSTADELVFPRPRQPTPKNASEWGNWGSSSHFHRKFLKMQDRVWQIYKDDMSKVPHAVAHSREDMMQNFHQFRHLWVSVLMTDPYLRVPLLSLSKMCGHFSPAFTAERYAGIIEKADKGIRQQVKNYQQPNVPVTIV